MKKFFKLIKSILSVIKDIKSIFGGKSKDKEEVSLQKEVDHAKEASVKMDVAEVNRLTNRLPLVLLALSLLISGCAVFGHKDNKPQLVVVAADRYQYPMTNDLGVVGWFVPQAVHIDFMEAMEIARYHRANCNQGGKR